MEIKRYTMDWVTSGGEYVIKKKESPTGELITWDDHCEDHVKLLLERDDLRRKLDLAESTLGIFAMTSNPEIAIKAQATLAEITEPTEAQAREHSDPAKLNPTERDGPAWGRIKTDLYGMIDTYETLRWIYTELAKKQDKADHIHIVNDDGTTSVGMIWPRGEEPKEGEADGK